VLELRGALVHQALQLAGALAQALDQLLVGEGGGGAVGEDRQQRPGLGGEDGLPAAGEDDRADRGAVVAQR
jgi:hypothetical protein